MKMYVDPAGPDDVEAMLAILHSRERNESWDPVPGDYWVVARDTCGIAAFLGFRVEADQRKLLLDQIECEYVAGRPTWRGRRGLALLADFFRGRAKAYELEVYALVNASNQVQARCLEKRGYRAVAQLYHWAGDDGHGLGSGSGEPGWRADRQQGSAERRERSGGWPATPRERAIR